MIHIGKKIREVLDSKGRTACWLAERIPCERSNVYSIFKRDSINLDLLYNISMILEHDFFGDLSAQLRRECRCGSLEAGGCAEGVDMK